MQKKLAIGLACLWLTAWFALAAMHFSSHVSGGDRADAACALCLVAESGATPSASPDLREILPSTAPLATQIVVSRLAAPTNPRAERPRQPRAPPFS